MPNKHNNIKSENDRNQINRIIQMEFYYDAVCAALQSKHNVLLQDDLLHEMYVRLCDYFENGQWRKDYEADEHGAFPSDLKRGVLAQDALYDLFAEMADHQVKL